MVQMGKVRKAIRFGVESVVIVTLTALLLCICMAGHTLSIAARFCRDLSKSKYFLTKGK